MKPVLFISDLHLCAERPEVNRVFFRFLEQDAPGAGTLYILGDLFEYWAGDDDLAEPLHREVAEGLRRFAASGVPVRLIPGNRDFLLGRRFEREAGVALIGDEAVIDLFGTPTLILHGDQLCTDDLQYQAFRARVRKPWLQKLFLALPRGLRKRLVGNIRSRSQEAAASKPPEIMDVNPRAVEEALRQRGCPRLIHGHTHRPARHLLTVDGRECERWVLPAWHEGGGYLRCDAQGVRAVSLPL
ncbi:MAG TPA: UDP-2,3-diacylglucosamine diphosphatase [Burkholderiales bacterium]